MERECVVEAATVEEAVDAALEQLGVQQDAVEYEVLEEPGRKLFGGDKAAKVKVWVRESYIREMEEAKAIARDVLEVEDSPEEIPAEVRRSEPDDLSDEELDKIADAAVAALKEILKAFDIEANIEEYEGDEGELILDVVGGDLAILIGRHGRTLDSLQTVVGAIATRSTGLRYPVIVDVEGYRHRRRAKLEEIAKRTADRAARQRGPVRMRPMNAYERRIVHMALRADTRVVTVSEGEDPFRQVVVKPR